MTDWKFADVYEAIAAAVPDRPCQIHGDRVVTWGELDARADALAADMVAAGLGHQAKVACYLYNCPEYLEAVRRRVQGLVRAGQHELPLRPRRDPLPVRQRRRRGRRLPRHVHASCSTGSATGCPASSGGTSWPTRPAPGPDWAHAVRGAS